MDINEAPRDTTVVEKNKSRLAKEHRGGNDACHNIADEWQSLQRQMITNDFICFTGRPISHIKLLVLVRAILVLKKNSLLK